ncbi:MAG: transposase [Chloroflexi bacterium]|nr:transposase [Chloroflexota bacterium]
MVLRARRVVGPWVPPGTTDCCSRKGSTQGRFCLSPGIPLGNNESAGKRKSGKTRKGNRALRQALVEAAHGAGRKKDSQLASQYRRLAARRGKKRAAVAVGHSILVIAYHIIKEGTEYHDLGGNYYDLRDRILTQNRLVRRLERLGLKVTVEPPEAAA